MPRRRNGVLVIGGPGDCQHSPHDQLLLSAISWSLRHLTQKLYVIPSPSHPDPPTLDPRCAAHGNGRPPAPLASAVRATSQASGIPGLLPTGSQAAPGLGS